MSSPPADYYLSRRTPKGAYSFGLASFAGYGPTVLRMLYHGTAVPTVPVRSTRKQYDERAGVVELRAARIAF